MPEFTVPHGLSYPSPDDPIKDLNVPAKLASDIKALALTADLAISDVETSVRGELEILDLYTLKLRPHTDLPASVDAWHGHENRGLFRFPLQSQVNAVEGSPAGAGPAIVTIKPIGSGGSSVLWEEYGGQQRVWRRTVSTTSSIARPWVLLGEETRTALHQLSMPGNNNLNDAAPAVHARVPLKFFCNVDTWELVLKNFNDQTRRNYGRLDFVEVRIGERAKDIDGNYTANYVPGTVAVLGMPQLESIGSDAERYTLRGLTYRLEAHKEYIIGYGFYTQGGALSHRGIGGSYIGAVPAAVDSFDVSNTWSPYTPLDVYIKPEISYKTPFYAYPGSSSETGLGSEYPLRDVWSWRHAESHGAVPALLGQSGSLLDTYTGSTNYVRQKFSTITRADKAIGNPGSNDIYSGQPLAEMKIRYAKFVQMMQDYFSGTVEAADVFPRASETEAIAAVRKGFNEWLYSLPENILVCHDRAQSVSGPDGLLDPKYNSGDNVHLNTDGQHIMAAAIINGSPTPDGITFRLDTDGVPYF